MVIYIFLFFKHYNAVIMTTMAFQITSLTVVYSTIYSDADQKNITAPRHLPLWGNHRDRWIPRTKGQLRGKCFHSMTSSCFWQVTLKYELGKKQENKELFIIKQKALITTFRQKIDVTFRVGVFVSTILALLPKLNLVCCYTGRFNDIDPR